MRRIDEGKVCVLTRGDLEAGWVEQTKLSLQPMRRRMVEPQEVSRSHSTHRDCEEGQNGNKLLKRRKVGRCIESRKLWKQTVHVRIGWKPKVPWKCRVLSTRKAQEKRAQKYCSNVSLAEPTWQRHTKGICILAQRIPVIFRRDLCVGSICRSYIQVVHLSDRRRRGGNEAGACNDFHNTDNFSIFWHKPTVLKKHEISFMAKQWLNSC